MTRTKKLTFASAIVTGFLALSASAFAGENPFETAAQQNINNGGYETGGKTIVRTYPADAFTKGAYLTEEGYEVQVVEINPSYKTEIVKDIHDPKLYPSDHEG